MARSRILPALLVTALSGVSAVLAATPAAAATSCAPAAAAAPFCVSALAWSPASVANSADATVSLQVTATAGLGCVEVGLASSVTGPWENTVRPAEVSGRPGVYQGSFTVLRGAAAGTYLPTYVYRCDQQSGVDAAALAAAGMAGFTVTGGAGDTQPSTVAGLTVTGSPLDVTLGDKTTPISVRITDPGTGARYARVVATPATVQSGESRGNGTANTELTRSSGTAQDGVWTGSVRLVGGTSTRWNLSIGIQDRLNNVASITTAQLSAAGLTSSLTSVTTAAPPAPPAYKVTSGNLQILYPNTLVGLASWTQSPAGRPVASEWLVTASGSCPYPAPTSWQVATTEAVAFRKPGVVGFCKITVRARNAVGTSSAVSGQAFLF